MKGMLDKFLGMTQHPRSEPVQPQKQLHRILIVIPAYNEQGNIQHIIQELQGGEGGFQILVVDDGSSDATALEAKRAGAFVISLPFNLGIGGAVQTGFKFADQNGFDVVVQVDGDGQHDVHFLEALMRPVLEDRADMTIGSRFLPPFVGYRSSFIRRVGIHFFAGLISFLTEYKVTDPTSGFRCYNKKIIHLFARYYPTDFPEPEAIVVAGRHQARIQEVPVSMRPRQSGRSSIRYFKTLYYMIKVTFAILLDKLKQPEG